MLLLRSPHSALTSGEVQKSLWGLTIRKLIVAKKRAEFATSAHILADQVLTCSPQVVVPDSSFAHLQSQDRGAVDQRTRQNTVQPDSGPQMKSLASAGPYSDHHPPPPGRGANSAYSIAGCSF